MFRTSDSPRRIGLSALSVKDTFALVQNMSLKKTSGKLQKAVYVGEITHQAHGDAHRARTLAVNAHTEIVKCQC